MNRLFQQIESDLASYERLTGRPWSAAKVLEIGYGARPNRMMALMGMGVDVWGIDLDQPMLRFNPATLSRIVQRNGVERALKSVARNVLFDRRDRAKLAQALQQRGYQYSVDFKRFLVGDASTFDFANARFDLVYSSDVFEHIPADALEVLVERLARLVSPLGMAIITPNVFPGITGGHLPEWYGDVVDSETERQSEPWEHLRKKRFVANSYLNGLSRASYRDLFSRHFHVLYEKSLQPDLGRKWLTPEVRADLNSWSEDELFSNNVEFALQPLPYN